MRHTRVKVQSLAVLALLLAFCTQACLRNHGLDCTLIGGFNGVSVEIPRAVNVVSGSVRIEVCDGRGCASVAQLLRRDPQGSTERGAFASFHALGRAFKPGVVSVDVQLRGPKGRLAATRHQEVELVRSYPNGKRCDGDGFVSGHVEMQPTDKLRTPIP